MFCHPGCLAQFCCHKHGRRCLSSGQNTQVLLQTAGDVSTSHQKCPVMVTADAAGNIRKLPENYPALSCLQMLKLSLEPRSLAWQSPVNPQPPLLPDVKVWS